MTKADLIAAVAEKASVSKKDAEAVIKAFQETVVCAAKAGDKVTLLGFGTFSSKEVPEKDGVAMGKAYHIDAHKELKFKAAKDAKNI